MAVTPEARPSITSIRLMVLIIPTIQKRVNGTTSQAGKGITPQKGVVMLSTTTPKAMGMEAIAICPISWGSGASRRLSSRIARGRIASAPSSTPSSLQLSCAERGMSRAPTRVARRKAKKRA